MVAGAARTTTTTDSSSSPKRLKIAMPLAVRRFTNSPVTMSETQGGSDEDVGAGSMSIDCGPDDESPAPASDGGGAMSVDGGVDSGTLCLAMRFADEPSFCRRCGSSQALAALMTAADGFLPGPGGALGGQFELSRGWPSDKTWR